jgi:hypothetical protein
VLGMTGTKFGCRRAGPTYGTGNRSTMMAAPARRFDPDIGNGTIAMPA